MQLQITLCLACVLVLAYYECAAQINGPWNSPLLWSEEISPDIFGIPQIFQDSSGVPSVVRKAGTDTMYCVFQWFREPRNTPTWDRIATKKSFDDGRTWAQPEPIVVSGLPTGYQRPFDPTIVCFGDSIRLYFSSSARLPSGPGLDSVVNTYSAVGVDGVHFIFEPGIRFDNATRPVIDPAVVYNNGTWRITAPIGAPQEGAYQGSSTDGLNFIRMNDIPSDNTHNWTGNMLVDEGGTIQFYGSGQMLWRAPETAFGIWGAYTSLGIRGGDPSAVTRRNGPRMIVYVGPPYVTSVANDLTNKTSNSSSEVQSEFVIAPNPVYDVFTITQVQSQQGTSPFARSASPLHDAKVVCISVHGETIPCNAVAGTVDTSSLPVGIYLVHCMDGTTIGHVVKLP